MRFAGNIFYILVVIAQFSCNSEKTRINYKQEMRTLVQKISADAKNYNPDFIIIPQNGHQLLTIDGERNGAADLSYMGSINGVGREDLFYGYDEDDKPTAESEKSEMLSFMNAARNNGIMVLATDYCSTPSNMDDSYSQNFAHGFISFSADHRDLDNIPPYPAQPFNENDDTITSLSAARNFLYLINPENYSSKQNFINAVNMTNYDVIIMDLFFNEEAFTSQEINSIKQKANGGLRKVICYMSIGEAEDYRYYWQKSWYANPPDFIVAENPQWHGNYKVKYWDSNWQNIIYRNGNSYLHKILDAGFDGTYLDIIDGFEYFEN